MSLKSVLAEADKFLARAQSSGRGKIKATAKTSKKGRLDARITASMDENTLDDLASQFGQSLSRQSPKKSGKKAAPKKAAPKGLTAAQVKRLVEKATEAALDSRDFPGGAAAVEKMAKSTAKAAALEKYKNMPPQLRAAMLKKLGF